ncbi:MAG: hypothetical protein JWP41_2991 [Ramlibacter sp.]|nr:hypothetical protein [Ramlibacter sp.]
MENLLYHVLLDGRRIGPYDRRTIVGMRMKKALTSAQVLEAADGAKLTVAQLVNRMQPADVEPVAVDEPKATEPPRAGIYSVVQGQFAATLLEVEGAGLAIPPFKGELEIRVQTRVLRIAGRVRDGLAWKEDRIKFPLLDIAHARLRGKVVDLWIRSASQATLQRLSLDLGSPESAGELAESLPHAAPWPGSEPLARKAGGGKGPVPPMLWVGLLGLALVVGALLVLALVHNL